MKNALQPNEIMHEIDEALNKDEEQPKAPSAKDEGPRRLTAVLRNIGGIVLLGATATFLLEGWNSMEHLARYYGFLGFLAAMIMSGFFCSFRFGDNRSARMLLALGAIAIPVSFCQLGALIYSLFPEIALHPESYPSALFWQAPSLGLTLATTGVSAAVLFGMSYISFSVLQRSQALLLTKYFFLGNALLLIPVRSANLVGLIALGLFALNLFLELKVLRQSSAARTFEGRLCRLLQFMPVGLLLGRTACLYPFTNTFLATFFFAIAGMLFFMIEHYDKKQSHIAAAKGAALFPLALGWSLLVADIFEVFTMPEAIQIPFAAVPFGISLMVLSFSANGATRFYRSTAATALVLAGTWQLGSYPGIGSSLFCLGASIFAISYAYTSGATITLGVGAIGFASALLYHLRFAIDIYTYSPWAGLAVTGIGTIVLAAVIERHWGVIRELTNTFMARRG